MQEYNKNDPQSIRRMFNSIAKSYDKTNAILSMQMHKRWNRALVENAIVPSKPKVLLDLCCGTGAIAFEYLQSAKEPTKVYMLDFSEMMLACAQEHAKKQKLHRHDINFLQADAQAIPLPEKTADCATIAYGIRNVKDPDACIKDVYRVLRPHGTFGILELTQPQNPILRFGHQLYLRTVLPVVGKLVTSNQEAYQYLCNSIHSFIPPESLAASMKSAGFTNIRKVSFLGGVATLLVGSKTASI